MNAPPEFATNPVERSSMTQAAGWLAAVQAPSRPWLLIDAALLDVEALSSALRRSAWTGINALATTPLAAYGPQAPQLIPLPEDASAIAEGLRRSIFRNPNAPAFSWFASAEPVKHLQALFGYLAQVRHDGMKLYGRWADTRVLPALLAALSAPQAQRVAQAISQWQWFDRSGRIDAWASPDPDPQLQEADPGPHLELNAGQFASILDAAEADGLFLQLLETVPQLVPKTGRAQFHRHLEAVLTAATELHVTGNPDRLQFVVLSLTCGDGFHKHPDLVVTWAAVREQQASLTALMKHWSDELWTALEGAAR